MLVSEMRRQEATYFLMNWETRGSEQGLMEEWAGGLCGWPGSVAEGQHWSVTLHLASRTHHVHPMPQCRSGSSSLYCGVLVASWLPCLAWGRCSAPWPMLDVSMGSPRVRQNQRLEKNVTTQGLTRDPGGRNQG